MNLKLEITNTSFLRQPINKGKKVSCPCASKFTPMLLSFIDSHTKKEEEEENLGFLGGRITLSLSLSLSLSQVLPSKLRRLAKNMNAVFVD
jgi:hypothetical protein